MKLRTLVLPLLLTAFTASCGHSEDEWQAQLAKYNKLNDNYDAEKKRVAELEKELREMGVNLETKSSELSKAHMTMDEQAKALAEYKARAHQLEMIKARFDMLRRKLDELTRFGLAVHIRRNRMVISLPGDVLFDSGRDTLKKEGEDILGKVAAVIRNDRGLLERDYQVAGHTDNQPLQGGPFHDNYGLSLMRARSVLVFLVGAKGILPKQHWSAAGFADTDPVANNGSKEGQQKNRRCDLVVLPGIDEMLSLNTIAGK